MSTVKEIAERHGKTHQYVAKVCKNGYFEIDGVKYVAVNDAPSGSQNARWNIRRASDMSNVSGGRGNGPEGDLKKGALAVKIKKDQAATTRIEQEIKERKIEMFMQYLSFEKEIMHRCSGEVKEFVCSLIGNDEQHILKWNETWETFIENVYAELSTAISESL